MIRLEIRVDDTILVAIEKAAAKAPGLMKTVYQRALSRMRGRILTRLKVAPPLWPPGKKRRWNSRRQQQAYFASDGFGAGIPYRRTGKLLEGYDVRVIDNAPNGALFELVNTDPKARFVVGKDAQLMHLDSKWVQMQDVANNAQVETANVLTEAFFTVTDIFAGVPK